MTNRDRKYPRIGSVSKINTGQKRGKCKCGQTAEYRVDIQYNYMRGDDDVVSSCRAHKDDIELLTAPTQSLAGEL